MLQFPIVKLKHETEDKTFYFTPFLAAIHPPKVVIMYTCNHVDYDIIKTYPKWDNLRVDRLETAVRQTVLEIAPVILKKPTNDVPKTEIL
jgi:hypothetical protein